MRSTSMRSANRRPLAMTGGSLLLIVLVLLTSCDLTGGLSGAITRATDVIDNGIRDITQSSATWQSVLQRVANDLPKEISDTIRVDAQSLANRAIGTVGVEFRCSVDFLGARAVQSLRALKAELLKQPAIAIPPAFCTVDPPAIDLKTAPSRWSTVVLYGYDLDHKDAQGKLASVLLLDANGVTTAMPENRIGRTTHYQMTLNIGAMARQLYQSAIVKIVLAWGGASDGYPQIVIVPWETQRVSEIVTVGSTGPYQPPHTGGDRDFDTGTDEPTSVDVRGEIQTSERTIHSRLYLHAREKDPDHTEVEGWSDWSLMYTAPQGWRIVEVRPSAAAAVRLNVTTNGTITANGAGGEVIDRFEMQIDRGGDEAGTWTQVIGHWRPLEITREALLPEWLR